MILFKGFASAVALFVTERTVSGIGRPYMLVITQNFARCAHLFFVAAATKKRLLGDAKDLSNDIICVETNAGQFALRLSIRLFYPKRLLQEAPFVVELAALILVR
jgi:hypothetical protein